MSEIKSFSDYTSKYNSNVDYSALFGETSDSSSVGNTNMLSDYAAIKNGSYGKLMKAYYAKQDAEKLSGKGDTSQKLTLMKTSADSLKKSADALNDASLWEKKKIKKKDEKTGEETEVEDYDWDAITKKVKAFIDDYNDVVKEAGESNTKDVLSRHVGVLYYTIGQRKGLNIDHEKGPWFVVGKDVVKNILYVCRTDQRDLLYSDSCIVKGINWILPSLDEIPTKCTCKFRYRQKDQDIEIERLDDTSVLVKYPQTIASVTEGQEAVFYDGDKCIGGGVIEEVFKDGKNLNQLIMETTNGYRG